MKDSIIINTLRHGETAYNAERRYAGTIDIPLNDTGIQDSIDAARLLAVDAFDIAITSTLKRSVQTAGYLCCGRIKTVHSGLCNERNYGKMQGLTEEEVKYIQPKIEYVYAGYDYHSLNPPGGESFETLRERAWEFYRYIVEDFKGLNVLVISHGTFLQQFHGLLKGKDWLQSLEQGVRNFEFTTFQFEGGRLLRETNRCLIERKGTDW